MYWTNARDLEYTPINTRLSRLAYQTKVLNATNEY